MLKATVGAMSLYDRKNESYFAAEKERKKERKKASKQACSAKYPTIPQPLLDKLPHPVVVIRRRLGGGSSIGGQWD